MKFLDKSGLQQAFSSIKNYIDGEHRKIQLNLTAGKANALTLQNKYNKHVIGCRVAGGGEDIVDGIANIHSLEGNSVIWNQIFTPTGGIVESGGCTFTWGEQGLSITGTLTETTPVSLSNPINFIKGRDYYVKIENPLPDGFSYAIFKNEKTLTFNGGDAFSFTATDLKYNSLYVIGVPDKQTVGKEYNYTSKIAIHDLSLFGNVTGDHYSDLENNIPLDIDRWEYNEGQFVSIRPNSIISRGGNLFDGKWYYGTTTGISTPQWYTNSIPIPFLGRLHIRIESNSSREVTTLMFDCNGNKIKEQAWSIISGVSKELALYNDCDAKYIIICNNSSNADWYVYVSSESAFNTSGVLRQLNQTFLNTSNYFENGLCKIGTYADRVYRDHIERYIGVVDLGELSWTLDDTNNYFVSTLTSATFAANIAPMCEKYRGTTPSVYDKVVFIPSVQSIYIKDSSYTDAESFKASLTGVKLYYVKYNPDIIKLDEPLFSDYPVWQGGIEEFDYYGTSLPLIANISYSLNSDTTRNNFLAIKELKDNTYTKDETDSKLEEYLSVDGIAASASKLANDSGNISSGSTNLPVYFSDGVPVECELALTEEEILAILI